MRHRLDSPLTCPAGKGTSRLGWGASKKVDSRYSGGRLRRGDGEVGQIESGSKIFLEGDSDINMNRKAVHLDVIAL